MVSVSEDSTLEDITAQKNFPQNCYIQYLPIMNGSDKPQIQIQGHGFVLV